MLAGPHESVRATRRKSATWTTSSSVKGCSSAQSLHADNRHVMNLGHPAFEQPGDDVEERGPEEHGNFVVARSMASVREYIRNCWNNGFAAWSARTRASV